MHTRSIGNIGEDVACKFLEKNGFVVRVRNYRKKWGEIDIIAQKKNCETVHFFEVKSVTFNRTDFRMYGGHHPEENVHAFKLWHIRRMIETYMVDSCVPFEFHVLCVYLNQKTHLARVKWLRNIVL